RRVLFRSAKSYLTGVAKSRRARGDTRGANEMVVRLGTVDPADIEARLAGARVLAESGDKGGAASRFRELYTDLLDKGRAPEAIRALQESARCNPGDREALAILAKAAVAEGN